jgi:tetratricopeptide (TPR) repeat protein
MVRALLLAAVALGLGVVQAAEPEDSFDRAYAAYAQGNWDAAAEGFRSVLRTGVADPRVEYNLAGAEYKRGHLGDAVLHYERARRLDPGDADTQGNLALVRGKLKDVLPSDAGDEGTLAGLRAFQDRLGVTAQGVVALVAVWLAAFLVVLGASRAGGFTPARSWLLAAAVLVGLLAGLSWRATDARLYGTPRAVVLAPSIEALAGPGLGNAGVFTLHEGATVEVTSERDGWMQVVLPTGATGWVGARDAERI